MFTETSASHAFKSIFPPISLRLLFPCSYTHTFLSSPLLLPLIHASLESLPFFHPSILSAPHSTTYPLACCKDLMSFLTFQVSTARLPSAVCWPLDMVVADQLGGDEVGEGGLLCEWPDLKEAGDDAGRS